MARPRCALARRVMARSGALHGLLVQRLLLAGSSGSYGWSPWIWMPALGRCSALLVISVYGKVGEGLGSTNLQLLQDLGDLVLDRQLPWIFVGDWNLVPEVISESG